MHLSPDDRRELSSYVTHVDRTKFAQVIRNLESNGLKFTPAGGSVTVSIEPGQRKNLLTAMSARINMTQRISRRADVLRIAVTDTGPGISQVVYYELKYKSPDSFCFYSIVLC